MQPATDAAASLSQDVKPIGSVPARAGPEDEYDAADEFIALGEAEPAPATAGSGCKVTPDGGVVAGVQPAIPAGLELLQAVPWLPALRGISSHLLRLHQGERPAMSPGLLLHVCATTLYLLRSIDATPLVPCAHATRDRGVLSLPRAQPRGVGGEAGCYQSRGRGVRCCQAGIKIQPPCSMRCAAALSTPDAPVSSSRWRVPFGPTPGWRSLAPLPPVSTCPPGV